MADKPQHSTVSPSLSSTPPFVVAQKEKEEEEEAKATSRTQTATTAIKTPENHAKILNINVGLLGHVDSGKTSLAKALSTIASTAAFDKNPQSVERGITLDLGFSSVVCDLVQQQSSLSAPTGAGREVAVGVGTSSCRSVEKGRKEVESHLAELFAPNALGVRSHLTASPYFIDRLPTNVYKRYVQEAGVSTVQLTLVDCPGHASLIRTIIGGASIVDVMILVIDATKGIQTQTAECIVLGEVLGRRLIIALNKVDMIQTTGNVTVEEARKMMKKMMPSSKKKKGGDKKEKKKDKKTKEEGTEKSQGGKEQKTTGGDDEGKGEDGVTKAGDTQEEGGDEDEFIEINEETLRALERRKIIDKIKKRLRAVFAQTKWPDVTFVEVAAAPGNNGTQNNNNVKSSGREEDISADGEGEGQGDTPADLEADLAERIAEKKKLLNKEKKKSSKSKAKDKAKEETSADGGSGGDGTSTSHSSSSSSFNVKALIDAVLCAVDPLSIIHNRSVTGGAYVPSTASSTTRLGGGGCSDNETALTSASSNATATINTNSSYDNKRIPVDSNSMALLQNAAKKNFLMIVDHCFAVKGHGTVLTGTVASGYVAVGDEITLPDLQLSKRVKSLQVFHEPVREAKQGDRVGLCVAGLDPSLLERGIICSSNALFLTNASATTTATGGSGGNDNSNSNGLSSPSPLYDILLSILRSRHVDRISMTIGKNHLSINDNNNNILSSPTPSTNVGGWGSMTSVPQRLSAVQSTVIRSNCFIAAVRKVRYHEQTLLTNSGASGTKYHITVGHSTEMGTLRYFSAPNPYYYDDDHHKDGPHSHSEAGLEDKDKKEEKKEKTSKKDKKDKHGTVAKKDGDGKDAARDAALFNQQLKNDGPLDIEPSATLQRGYEGSLFQLVDLLSAATASGNGVLSSGSKKSSGAFLNASAAFPFGFAYEEELLDDPFSSEDENEEDREEYTNTEAPKKKKESKKSKSEGQEADEGRISSADAREQNAYVPPLLASAVAKPPRQRRRVLFALVQLDNPIVLSTSVSGETLGRLCCASPQISSISPTNTNTNNSNRSRSSAGAGGGRGFVTHTPPVLLASRFDTDLKSTTCRLAVEGSVVSVLADWENAPQQQNQSSGPQHTHMTTNTQTTTASNSIGGVGVPAPPEAILSRCKSSPNADDAFAIDILQHYLFTAYRRVFWRSLPIAKPRSKVFMVDRIVDDHTCIVQVPPKPNAHSQQHGDNTKNIANKKGSQATAGGGSGTLLPHEVRDMSVFVKMKVFCVITTAPAEATAEEEVAAGENTTKSKTKKASATTAAVGPGTNIDISSSSVSSPRVEWGVVEGPFGQNTNKLRVRFTNPVYRRQDTNGSGTSSTSQGQRVAVSREVVLPYQKYPFALHSPMAQ